MMKARQTGFTIVELMVTLLVAAILAAIAVPSFRATIEGNRVTAATNALVATLQQARSEAVRRNARITICKGGASATDCNTATGSSWEDGWILFSDKKVDTGLAVDAGQDQILRHGGQGLAGTIKIVEKGSGPGYVSFNASGRFVTVGATAAPMSTVFRVCSSSSALGDDSRARDISVSAAGVISSQRATSVSAGCPAP